MNSNSNSNLVFKSMTRAHFHTRHHVFFIFLTVIGCFALAFNQEEKTTGRNVNQKKNWNEMIHTCTIFTYECV